MKTSLTKLFLLTAAVAVALAGLTLAGPTSAEKNVAPAPAPECDWSGFYIGINVGGATLQSRFTDLDYFEGYDTRQLDDTNVTAGGQVGYNWQLGAFVFGIEADGAYVNTEVHTHTIFADTGTNNDFQEDNSKLDFLGTVRGRAGIGVQNALIYVTAGLAYAHGDWEELYYEPEPGETPNFGADRWTGDDWRIGWTAGVGAEYMFNCNWTIRLETLYTHLEDDTVHASEEGSRIGNGDTPFRYMFQDELWTVRLGVNYKFNRFFGH